MKAARMFNPLHIMGNKIGRVDIHNLKLFQLSRHSDIRSCLDGMKAETSKYNGVQYACAGYQGTR